MSGCPRLTRYLRGSCRLCCPDGVRLTNLLLHSGASTLDSGCENGVFWAEIPLRQYNALLRVRPDLFERNGVSLQSRHGLPALLRRYRSRPGIAVGALLFAGILALSANVVWEIEITGAQSVPASEILAALEELGFHEGSFLPGVDFYDLSARLRARCPELAWASVNQSGVRAHVEIREHVAPEAAPGEEDPGAPANLIAAADGIIQRYEVYEGIEALPVGSMVKKGDLLVSGVRVGRYGALTLLHASGHVYAQTSAFIETHIPLTRTEKRYTGRVVTENTLKIFGKSINLYRKRCNSLPKYDTMESSRRLTLLDGAFRLPAVLHSVRHYEYTEGTTLLSEEEARALAHRDFAQKLRDTVGDGKILRQTVEEGVAQNEYRILCEIYYIADIARASPIGAH